MQSKTTDLLFSVASKELQSFKTPPPHSLSYLMLETFITFTVPEAI